MSDTRRSFIAHAATELRGALAYARAGVRASALGTVAALTLAALLPVVVRDPGTMADVAAGVYLVVAAIGLNFALGLADVPSLGHGAFVAVGAFAAALLRTRAGWGFVEATFVATAAAAIAGALVGAGAARLKTIYVAVATWIVAWLVASALVSFPGVFGGAQGLVVTTGAVTPAWEYEVALAAVGIGVALYAGVARGPAGLALAAVREGPATAAAVGAPATRLRIGAIVTGAALAGLAGAGIAQTLQVADPTAYGPLLSVKLFVAVLLGGSGTVLGPIAGAAGLALISPAAHALGDVLGVAPERFEPALAAALLLVALALGRGGIVRAARSLRPGSDARRPTPPVSSSRSLGRPPGFGLAVAADAVSKRYGGVRALDGVDLTIGRGEIQALIGPNGSGKSTLLRVLAGAEVPDAGDVLVEGRSVLGLDVPERLRLGVARTLQRTEVWPDLTVAQHVLAGVGPLRNYSGAIRNLVATPQARAEAVAANARATDVLELAGLADRADARAASLSSGDRRLLTIAMAFASAPGALLLDEPSAGMSHAHAEKLAEMLDRISSTGVSLLIVEHNLRLVRYLAARVTVLDAGTVIAEGTVADVAADPVVRDAYLGRTAL